MIEDFTTMNEKIEMLGKANGIADTTDYFGKFLLLHDILESMDKDEANTFMADTLSMVEDDISKLYNELSEDEK